MEIYYMYSSLIFLIHGPFFLDLLLYQFCKSYGIVKVYLQREISSFNICRLRVYFDLMGQSHEKVGERRVEGDSLGPN
jgi:hypothetical protein